MSVYAIAQGRVDDQKKFNQYIELAVPTLEKHKVKTIALDESPVLIEGNVDYPRTVILEFTDKAAFDKWYKSPEYQKAREHRVSAAFGTFILVNGI
ncbi:MAG: DUF1330 domain-containing protein [Pseudomonadota bacterium]|nr:DUF1330 domain-containing protein [Pseudomonadota bacterium]